MLYLGHGEVVPKPGCIAPLMNSAFEINSKQYQNNLTFCGFGLDQMF